MWNHTVQWAVPGWVGLAWARGEGPGGQVLRGDALRHPTAEREETRELAPPTPASAPWLAPGHTHSPEPRLGSARPRSTPGQEVARSNWVGAAKEPNTGSQTAPCGSSDSSQGEAEF